MQFSPGQRWLSDTESDLGLGTVIDVNHRQVTLLFPASGETRVYAKQTSPLTRLALEPDEMVSSHEGWQMRIDKVTEKQGQLTYHGVREDTLQTVALIETFVDHKMQLNQPHKRLLNGQFDGPQWFDLRYECWQQQYQHHTSPLLGFVGARVDLIPHQLHIARQVGQRYAPRVLLADEVGLGKTIEAALIIHQQILSGRASRVLIVVPSSLVHQWLVEMLRRVNLAFAIFDAERCQSLAEEGGNPFESEQLVICSLDFLTQHSDYLQQAQQCDWDLMVVDEAHHLQWSAEAPSIEYQAVEQLAQKTKGVLLLTATPEQLGHQSHFARLRLLDADRFHDYQQFVEQEQHYAQLAEAISPLLEGQPLNRQQQAAIEPFVQTEPQLLQDLDVGDPAQCHRLISHLLDCHGTGRLLFRNSRSGISGFPRRQLISYALQQPPQYARLSEQQNINLLMSPERHPDLIDSWVQFDPRVEWFIDLLKQHKGKKVLAICTSAGTALALSEAVRVQSGIRASVFHEGMSIVERDKAAAYFAQREDGAQVLICSEIGSEGRNFQFAHHLVLFDLPAVPDLLEQRIGRLDRIGQQADIQIHVPYFNQSAQQVLLDWYHQGLDAFEHTCPTGNAVYQQLKTQLQQAMLSAQDETLCYELINQTASLHRQFKQQLEQGRDKLLEINSSGKGTVDDFIDNIYDSDQSVRLEKFMTYLFDTIGIIQEENDESSYLLKPSEAMHHSLPGLDEEGTMVTYERQAALQFEQLQFLSWDHPMVQHAQDTILADVKGKASVAIYKDPAIPVGFFWLEAIFVLAAKAPKHLQLQRFLPPTPIRICIDPKGNVSEEQFDYLNKVNRKTAQQLISALTDKIETGLTQLELLAQQQGETLRKQSLQRMESLLGEELHRLHTLQKVNPSIRDEEIEHLSHQLAQLGEIIGQAEVQFEALRLVVNTH
ncbi:RNA polymerase-associated protein RapA [Neptunicella sp. SCSIO 80796]|uniref:RNA polymerase-associated protein RapA n=1 Tax=Neptunicella plasticusilytica TaxID=3117012 RepID=UPI003A4D2F39